MCYQKKELQQLDPAAISSTCLVSLQQPSGILLLEEGLLHAGTNQDQPPAKRSRGRKEIPPDTNKWIHLARYNIVFLELVLVLSVLACSWILGAEWHTTYCPYTFCQELRDMYRSTTFGWSYLFLLSVVISVLFVSSALQTLQIFGGLWCRARHLWW